MRHILTTAAIALSVLASPAQAVTFEWWKNAEDSYGIKISGEIGKGDAERFRRTLLDADPYYGSGATFMVYLDSPGGRVFEAIEIGNAIRSLGFNTFVADEAICTSACGLIWLAGDRRYLGANAALGFHTVYDPRTRQPTPVGLAWVEAYMSRLGIGQPTFRYLTQASADSIEWLTPDKAKQYGIENVWTCIKCSGDKAAPGAPLQEAPVRPAVPSQTVLVGSKVPVVPRVVRTVPIQPTGTPAPTIVPASAPIPRSTRAVR